MTYMVCESQPHAHLLPESWMPITAKTLAGAKQAAKRRQRFHGTALHVGVRVCGEIERVATWHPEGPQSGWNEFDD